MKIGQKTSQYLSSDQQAEYLRRAREGDTYATEVLVQNYLHLVDHIVKPYFIPKKFAWLDRDDLVQVGRIGLLKAISSFIPQRGEFSKHAYFRIKNEISKIFLGENRKKRKLSDFSVHIDNETQATIGELLPDNNNVSSDMVDARIDTEKLLKKLKNHAPLTGKNYLKHAELIEMLYHKDLTQQEAAESLRISKQAVNQKAKRALEIMRGLAVNQKKL